MEALKAKCSSFVYFGDPFVSDLSCFLSCLHVWELVNIFLCKQVIFFFWIIFFICETALQQNENVALQKLSCLMFPQTFLGSLVAQRNICFYCQNVFFPLCFTRKDLFIYLFFKSPEFFPLVSNMEYFCLFPGNNFSF